MTEKFNFLKYIDSSEAESHRILNLYTRYMLKKFKLKNYDHYIFENCPRYSFHLLHINGIILKSIESSYLKKDNLIYNPTQCIEIDILVKRFIKKKYKINLIYSKNYLIKNYLIFKPFKYSLINLIKEIIIDLKETKLKKSKDKNHSNKKYDSSLLILSHEHSKKNASYNNFSNKVAQVFSNSGKKIIILKPSEIGLTFNDKFRNLLYIVKILFAKIIFYKKIKFSDLHFIIFQIYNNIYKNKLKRYFIKNKIKKIISTYITYRYEPIYYEAAREANIKFLTLDYSLGYPILEKTYYRYLPDTKKIGNIIFSNSIFRTEQYLDSLSFLKKSPQIKPLICPQADYFKKQKNIINLKSGRKTIGIVDGNEWALGNDIYSIVKLLSDTKYEITFLLQSKSGQLEKEFKRYNFDEKYLINGTKGNLTNLRNADFIISIGWQSAALKAAAFFEKPLIFYTILSYPYDKHFFSFKKIKNKRMNQLCSELWFYSDNFINKFEEIIQSDNEFKSIKNKSSELLEEIGFYKGNIEEYIESYLK